MGVLASVPHPYLTCLTSKTSSLTPKLAKHPTTNPSTSEKLITVAAVSTSTLLFSNLGLCSSDGAQIIRLQDMNPFVRPRSKTSRKNTMSELITGAGRVAAREEIVMLHMLKRGINSTLPNERHASFRGDETNNPGKFGKNLPAKSPTLNRTK